MASVIKLRTISAVDDKRIQLANSNFARPLPTSLVGAWSKIRVGVRCIMDNTGANLVSTPRFFVGLCSGSSNLFLDATTTHAVGLVSDDATWTYAAGPPIRYGALNSFRCGKRVGSTLTTGSAPQTGLQMFADPATANRFMIFVDIQTGSPNYTFGAFLHTGTTTDDITTTMLLNDMPLTTPSRTNHSFNGVGTQTLAVNEGTDGVLNHVHVAWDRATPVIEICDLVVARLA